MDVLSLFAGSAYRNIQTIMIHQIPEAIESVFRLKNLKDIGLGVVFSVFGVIIFSIFSIGISPSSLISAKLIFIFFDFLK